MKLRKKLTVALLSVVLCFAFAPMAFAKDVPTGAGGTGSITITDCVQAKDYTLYKLFTAEASAGSATVFKTDQTDLQAGGINGNQWFDLGAGGVVTAKATTTSDMLQDDNFKAWAKAFSAKAGFAPVTGTAEADKIIKYTEVLPGYYFIDTTSGSLVMVDSATGDITMKDKNTFIPHWDDDGKVIIDATTQQAVKINPATMQLGKPVNYKVSIATKLINGANGKKIYRYYAYDVLPGGMTYTNNPTTDVKVTVDGVEVQPAAPGNVTGYTIQYFSDEDLTVPTTDVSQARGFYIDVPWTTDNTVAGDHLYANDAKLVITYSAFLDQAKVNQIIFTGKNTNRAGFDWYEDGNDPQGQRPDNHQGESTTDTIAANVEIFKFYKQGMDRKALEGVEFELVGAGEEIIYTQGTRFVLDPAGDYWQLKPVAPAPDPTYTKTDPNTAGIDQNLYASLTDKYRSETYSEIQTGNATTTNINGYTGANGKLNWGGLSAGTYTIREKGVPGGYNKAEDITFTISYDPTTGTWSSNNPAVTVDPATNTFKVDVENKKGGAMPSTGGMGTVLLYACGAALLIGTGIVAYTRRRTKKQLS